MTQDGSGNILVAGFGGSQSMVVARFTPAGVYSASAVCYAPHLIDYTARALALRPNGSIVLAGYARDRHASAAVPPTGPAVLYGLRAIVTLPASGNSTTACGAYNVAPAASRSARPASRSTASTTNGTVADPALGGRYYDAVVALPDNRFILATTNGPDGSAWVQRYSGRRARSTARFAGGRVALARELRARTRAARRRLGAGSRRDGRRGRLGEPPDAGRAHHGRRARMAAWGTGGIRALARRRRQQHRSGDRRAGRRQRDRRRLGQPRRQDRVRAHALHARPARATTSFGNQGETTTPFGTPAVNGYITGMALSGNLLAVAGRLTNAAGLVVTAARYYATGAPPPPPPPPAVSTLGVDGITASGARVTGTVNANGTAATWWLEYGTTTAYGTKSAAQNLAATTNDVDVGVNVTGLAAGTLLPRAPRDRERASARRRATTSRSRRSEPPAAEPPGRARQGRQEDLQGAQGVGKKLNVARKKVFAAGCKVKVVYKKSKRPKNIVLKQSRKANKKLVYHAVVKLTVSTKFTPKKKAKAKAKKSSSKSTTKAYVATR